MNTTALANAPSPRWAALMSKVARSTMLVTNVPDLKNEEIVPRYKSLADIERGFHVLKSEIEIAPVFHRLASLGAPRCRTEQRRGLPADSWTLELPKIFRKGQLSDIPDYRD